MNKTEFIGNLGKDPESRFTPSGQQVTSFPVAVNRSYTTQSGEKVKETMWYRVSAWGKLAEICNEYLKKGSKVYILGALTPDKATGAPKIWTDKEGKPHASYDLTATSVEFLSARVEDSQPQAEHSDQPEEEVPF